MRFEDFRDRGAAVRSLCEAFLAGAPSHATLITGPPGVGKRTLACLCGQSLFCAAETKPCGECPACRRYRKGSHPDSYHIPENKSIGVDTIRALTLALQSAAYEGGYKAVRIECAGAMTVQAQNSLLKTLEEPPPRTVFLLTATDIGEVLPTIRSRCRVVRMPPMPEERVEAILVGRGIEPGRAARLAALSQGSVGQAFRMQEDDGFWALRERVTLAIEGVRQTSDVLAAVNALKDDKGDAVLVLSMLEDALRGSLVRSLTGGARRAEPWGEKLTGLGARRLARLLESARMSRRMLKSNVPWPAVLERFLMEYAEALMQSEAF
ncbi:MAG: DNA polymerase III subunit delta' [Firmicutes bacterium]|nr:DNA polymerase III subunit delta' [Bacillota bacterium]